MQVNPVRLSVYKQGGASLRWDHLNFPAADHSRDANDKRGVFGPIRPVVLAMHGDRPSAPVIITKPQRRALNSTATSATRGQAFHKRSIHGKP